MPCEDQAVVATKRCTRCRTGFTKLGKAIYAKLVKADRFWRCERCGGSYGEHPHPDLK